MYIHDIHAHRYKHHIYIYIFNIMYIYIVHVHIIHMYIYTPFQCCEFPLITNSTIWPPRFFFTLFLASRSMDFYELRSNPVLLKEAKMRGFSDRQIAALVSIPEKILVECTLAKMDLLVGLSFFFQDFF